MTRYSSKSCYFSFFFYTCFLGFAIFGVDSSRTYKTKKNGLPSTHGLYDPSHSDPLQPRNPDQCSLVNRPRPRPVVSSSSASASYFENSLPISNNLVEDAEKSTENFGRGKRAKTPSSMMVLYQTDDLDRQEERLKKSSTGSQRSQSHKPKPSASFSAPSAFKPLLAAEERVEEATSSDGRNTNSECSDEFIPTALDSRSCLARRHFNESKFRALVQAISNEQIHLAHSLITSKVDYSLELKLPGRLAPFQTNLLNWLIMSDFKATTLLTILLKENGYDLNRVDSQGYSALHMACQRGATTIIQILRHRGALINMALWGLETGTASIHIACLSNNVPVLQMLLSCPDIKVNTSDSYGRTPLMCCISSGSVEAAHLLLQQKSLQLTFQVLIEAFEFISANPVENAAFAHLICDQMLRLGPGHNRSIVETILHFVRTENLVLLRFFHGKGLNLGSSVHYAGRLELNSMTMAVQMDRVDIMVFLNSMGVPYDSVDISGASPIHHAFLNHSLQALNHLLSFGHPQNLRLSMSTIYCLDSVVLFEILRSYYNLETLQAACPPGSSLLTFACSQGALNLVKYFILNCRISPFAPDFAGKTPHQTANEAQKLNVIGYLEETFPFLRQ